VINLLFLAQELNSPDYHVFLNFSGHINQIYISVHHGGWKEKVHPTNSFEIYTDDEPRPLYAIDTAIAWLKEDHRKFREGSE